MPAGTYNMSIEAGAGFTRVFTQKDDLGAAVPFPAGATAQFQARVTARAAGTPLLELTATPSAGGGTVTVNAAAGTVTLQMNDADTRVFDMPNVGSFVYAIEIHWPGEPSVRFIEGTISCSAEVVRE
jgi:hypothetical protein